MDGFTPREACGVFGIYGADDCDAARLAYYGLYALQHRGQESAGIAVVSPEGEINCHKAMGLASEVFSDDILDALRGKSAIGHCRYSTTGDSIIQNAQPMIVNSRNGCMAMAHNGNIVNASRLRAELEETGAVFQSTTDTEVMANLIAKKRIGGASMTAALQSLSEVIKGSYSLVILTEDQLYGMRDPLGIKPLCLGRLGDAYVLASESCAVEAVGGRFVRDIMPGEIVSINEDGLMSFPPAEQKEQRLCIFEYVYFARTDSVIDGISVSRARMNTGTLLAIEKPVNADIVIGVPDGGVSAAMGYSRESGIPFGQGLIKNKYVGRTFIQPRQQQRVANVYIKFNAIKSEIAGKRVIMIDDSIVRGTTTRRIVQMLREAGAREVHMMVTSPPYKYPCYLGIDIPSSEQLVASDKTIEEIRGIIGADSLYYISLDGLRKSMSGFAGGFCTACFDNNHPYPPQNDC